MDNINNKSDKMNKPDKPDKLNNNLNKTDGINKTKLMNIFNKKIMHTSVLVAIVVLLMTIFVQDETMWNSLIYPLEIVVPGIRAYLPRKPIRPKVENQINQFADSTTGLFKDLSFAEIPAPSEITLHVDTCNEIAALLERCKAYKESGKIAATHLREFSNLLYETGDILREMFVESKTVHYIFDIEVKAMIDQFTGFSSIFVKSDSIKIRLLKLENAIIKFRILVEKTMKKIMEVQTRRDLVSQRLLDAQIEAADHKVDNYSTKNFDLTVKAINGVKIMKEYLDGLATGLKEVRGKLKDYELNVNKVKENIGTTKYEVTRENLQHLKAAVELWKESHNMFLSKQNKPVING